MLLKELQQILKSKDVYIFDFDGVLVDSVEIKTKAFATLFNRYGQDVVRKVVAHHLQNTGINRFEKIRYYHKHYIGKPLPEDEIGAEAEEFSRLVIRNVIDAPEIPGATRFLDSCYGNKGCYVNSATPETELQEIIIGRGWEHYFRGIYGSPVSKEENLLRLFNEHNVIADSCVYFGDSFSDITAANSARMFFIGVNIQEHIVDSCGMNIACRINNFEDLE